MKIIPAIDLKDGNCVRLYKGDFAQQTHYSSNPLDVARQYRDMGFTDLHIVDLDGARSGTQKNREQVEQLVADSGLAVQLGGGIRNEDSVRSWLDAGVCRAVIGSLAVDDPDTVRGWMQALGGDRFVLALDCQPDDAGVPWLATHGWTRATGVTLWDCVAAYRDAGLQHVLCTDISRDGAMSGPSLGLYREFVERFPDIQLQASGGVRNIADLEAARAVGAAAAISGRALLDGCISKTEVTSFLRGA